MAFSTSQMPKNFVKSRVEDEWFDEFLAWVMWKNQYSHFRSHSIHIVKNYNYADLTFFFWKIRQIIVKCVHEFYCHFVKCVHWSLFNSFFTIVVFNNDVMMRYCDKVMFWYTIITLTGLFELRFCVSLFYNTGKHYFFWKYVL